MLTGKALFNSLLTELNEMGLPGMSATLDEMYRSPDFLELDPFYTEFHRFRSECLHLGTF